MWPVGGVPSPAALVLASQIPDAADRAALASITHGVNAALAGPERWVEMTRRMYGPWVEADGGLFPVWLRDSRRLGTPRAYARLLRATYEMAARTAEFTECGVCPNPSVRTPIMREPATFTMDPGTLDLTWSYACRYDPTTGPLGTMQSGQLALGTARVLVPNSKFWLFHPGDLTLSAPRGSSITITIGETGEYASTVRVRRASFQSLCLGLAADGTRRAPWQNVESMTAYCGLGGGLEIAARRALAQSSFPMRIKFHRLDTPCLGSWRLLDRMLGAAWLATMSAPSYERTDLLRQLVVEVDALSAKDYERLRARY
jgi:hypothetical protein